MPAYQILAYTIIGYVCLQADIEDLADITVYLHPLGRTAVIHLGLVLGLDYHRLRPLIDSPDFLTEMLAGWIYREWIRCKRLESQCGGDWWKL